MWPDPNTICDVVAVKAGDPASLVAAADSTTAGREANASKHWRRVGNCPPRQAEAKSSALAKNTPRNPHKIKLIST
eukprot:4598143-Alexandrium_andersonii.AAC.1